MGKVKCPYCSSLDSFEVIDVCGHPYLSQYSCTECGVCSPFGMGGTEKEAQENARKALEEFMDRLSSNRHPWWLLGGN